MRIDILKEVATVVAGDKAKGIVDILFKKQNVNEFLVSKKLKLTINSTRNLLYKLADDGLVSFIRKKDNKKGGWYTYFWTLNEEKGLLRFRDDLVNKNQILSTEMNSRGSQRFYYCPNCDIEYNEEDALLNDYTCLECGEIVQLKDSSENIKNIEKELKKNEELLAKVNAELAELEKAQEKTKIRKLKIEEKKKKEEKEARKKLREKEKAKLAKTISKNKTSKKSSKKKKQ